MCVAKFGTVRGHSFAKTPDCLALGESIPTPLLVPSRNQVHYGRASLTPLSRTPAYFVFPRRDVDVEALASAIASSDPWRAARDGHETVVCFLDQAHAHLEADLCRALESAAAGGAGGHWVWASIGSRELEPAAPAGCGCRAGSTSTGDPAAAADSA